MNANDVICVGADPIALLDYIAVEEANPEVLEQIGIGLREGAEQAGVEIPGGELAVLPDLVRGHPSPRGFDLVGLLRRARGPRRDRHRRPRRAGRRAVGHPVERHPLERAEPGPRACSPTSDEELGRRRRSATCCSSRP